MWAYKKRLNNLDIENFDKDYKTIFQEIIQKKHKTSPVYKSYEYYDENNHETFKAEVYVNDKNFALGIGKSKKEAETNAAKKALDRIEMASITIKKNKKTNK